ncbi:hypothetical protein [Bradyrhizobium sp. CCBAU 11386]|uniref:hypothetical protein n=1 Tax=Bradyrhizobium sp. CCBAU 11386 TaxID=1630837 RepID=UPI002304037B|nr:hypothetical protein [Bradyrhizobium sp. CCBAU 11386]
MCSQLVKSAVVIAHETVELAGLLLGSVDQTCINGEFRAALNSRNSAAGATSFARHRAGRQFAAASLEITLIVLAVFPEMRFTALIKWMIFVSM